MRFFWYLVEDFSEQSLFLKLFIGWGWLSVLIMLTSIGLTTNWGALAG